MTLEALKFYGYEVKVCWVCWSTFGPREMGDKSKPVLPPGAENYPTVMYVEPPPTRFPTSAPPARST